MPVCLCLSLKMYYFLSRKTLMVLSLSNQRQASASNCQKYWRVGLLLNAMLCCHVRLYLQKRPTGDTLPSPRPQTQNTLCAHQVIRGRSLSAQRLAENHTLWSGKAQTEVEIFTSPTDHRPIQRGGVATWLI